MMEFETVVTGFILLKASLVVHGLTEAPEYCRLW